MQEVILARTLWSLRSADFLLWRSGLRNCSILGCMNSLGVARFIRSPPIYLIRDRSSRLVHKIENYFN